MEAKRVAIAGATGVVGLEFLKVLDKRNFPISSLKLLASERSVGKKLTFKGKEYEVELLTEDSFNDIDIALFSAGGAQSKKFAPAAAKAGAVVVDNSSAYRMDPNVPLVVPEINPEDVKWHKGIIANPNCSTIIMLMPIFPLHKEAKVKRLVISTYQAASGAGIAAMRELDQQTKDIAAGKTPKAEAFPYQIAYNLFNHNSDIGEDGYNTEEVKMIKETRKILHDDSIQVTATCVRVATLRAHAEAINAEFENTITEQKATELLSKFPGVQIIDDRKKNYFPMPLEATGKDDCFVGRIRKDVSNPEGKGLDLFVCGDQILKGAALNAVQIAELL